MKLTDNFDRTEFECNCGCGQDTIDFELIKVLEKVREEFGPVYINSGNRCEEYNKQVGGSKRSQHLCGRAADIVVKSISPKKIADFVEELLPDHGGVGRYETFTHIDTRSSKARWDNDS